jgi:hypothetical protein
LRAKVERTVVTKGRITPHPHHKWPGFLDGTIEPSLLITGACPPMTTLVDATTCKPRNMSPREMYHAFAL